MPHDQPVVPVVAGDGHRFDLIRVPAESPGRHMLLLPGMGLSARQYIRFARALAARGVEVFIHEWRGNGSSSLRASRRCDWGYRELLEQDLTAAQQAVVERTGEAGMIIGGHSLGAQLACLLAALHRGQCRGIVLIAGGSPYWRLFPLPMKLVMIGVMVGFPALGLMLGYYPGKRLGFAGNEARSVIADWTRSARTGEYRLDGMDCDFETAMAGLEVPVLGMRMADDWFIPEASLAWLTGKLEGCAVTRLTIQADEPGRKADHYAWMKDPGNTADVVVGWLSASDSTDCRPGRSAGASRQR